MEQGKKQKVMLAILAVAALGAGSYFFVFRESDNASAAVSGPDKGPRKRADAAATEKKDNRRERKETAAAPVEDKKRERVERADTADRGPRERKDKGREKVKKAKIVPAA